MLDKRENGIQSLLDIVYRHLDGFAAVTTSGDGPRHYICPLPSCDAFIYGSLLISLQTQKLWPRKTAKDIHLSFMEHASVMEGLSERSYPDVTELSLPSKKVNGHAFCKYRLKIDSQLIEAEEAIDLVDPVLDCHKRHMADRRKMQDVAS